MYSHAILTHLIFNINQSIMRNISTIPISNNQPSSLPTCSILRYHRIF